MPNELEILEQYLNEYENWLSLMSCSRHADKEYFKIKLDSVVDFKVMIQKVKDAVKDFDNTVSGSGG